MATTADATGPDRRRSVPRTDVLLADPRVATAASGLAPSVLKAAVAAAQQRCRDGEIAPADVLDEALAALPPVTGSMRPVLNATGVLLHTNLGRAPLSDAAVAAVVRAAGPTDVELDLRTGHRAGRGRGAIAALRAALPDAGAVHVVNNNAAALVLAATALAAGREMVISRGELVEIGAGFRLPDLLESTGARLREVGTTNRTTRDDYAEAIGPHTALVLKVHPSNFLIRGFTAAVPVREIAGLGVPLVVDVGSGLLAPHPRLPDEPDLTSALRDGADLVTASGDKLLGGPQAGLLAGDTQLIERLRRHPLARAMRVDKLTLAALEATLAGPSTPTSRALSADAAKLRGRAELIVKALLDKGIDASAIMSRAAVGGGGAPEVGLPSAAVSLPARYAEPLRRGDPAVLGHVIEGRLLLDLLAVPSTVDDELCAAVVALADD